MDRARQQTGFDDFGADHFREGLECLLAAITSDAGLNENGRIAMDAQIVDLLANRLRVEDCFSRHPEIDAQEITAPLIILGLPRTGSTALACMLGEDPAYRSLRNWEARRPCPPPAPATALTDPRIAAAEEAMRRRARLFPRMTAMLPSAATAPTECQLFMGYDFKSQIFQAHAHIPRYVEWLNNQADLVPTYHYVKRVLKLLQWHWPKSSWRLKSPSHSLFITALNEVFPDARFVMTHRDVAEVVPSVADVYFELHKAFCDTVDLPELGRVTSDFCALAMQRMIAFRDDGHEHRFFDIYFTPFQTNPLAIIEALYEFLGEDLTAAARTGMESWRRRKPRDEQGYARTDPAAFGLHRSALHKKFEFYAARFGLH
jgi:hypothetical protein